MPKSREYFEGIESCSKVCNKCENRGQECFKGPAKSCAHCYNHNLKCDLGEPSVKVRASVRVAVKAEEEVSGPLAG